MIKTCLEKDKKSKIQGKQGERNSAEGRKEMCRYMPGKEGGASRPAYRKKRKRGERGLERLANRRGERAGGEAKGTVRGKAHAARRGNVDSETLLMKQNPGGRREKQREGEKREKTRGSSRGTQRTAGVTKGAGKGNNVNAGRKGGWSTKRRNERLLAGGLKKGNSQREVALKGEGRITDREHQGWVGEGKKKEKRI